MILISTVLKDDWLVNGLLNICHVHQNINALEKLIGNDVIEHVQSESWHFSAQPGLNFLYLCAAVAGSFMFTACPFHSRDRNVKNTSRKSLQTLYKCPLNLIRFRCLKVTCPVALTSQDTFSNRTIILKIFHTNFQQDRSMKYPKGQLHCEHNVHTSCGHYSTP